MWSWGDQGQCLFRFLSLLFSDDLLLKRPEIEAEVGLEAEMKVGCRLDSVQGLQWVKREDSPVVGSLREEELDRCCFPLFSFSLPQYLPRLSFLWVMTQVKKSQMAEEEVEKKRKKTGPQSRGRNGKKSGGKEGS